MKSMNHKSAFTFTELMVMITLIAALLCLGKIAILSARNSARESRCNANLDQIYKACVMYADDFRGVFPMNLPTMVIDPDLDSSHADKEQTNLRVETSMGQTFNRTVSCPFKSRLIERSTHVENSYGINNQVSGFFKASNPSQSYLNIVKENTVVSPSTTALVSDARDDSFLNFPKNPDGSYRAPSMDEPDFSPRHGVKFGIRITTFTNVLYSSRTSITIPMEDWSVANSDATVEDRPVSAGGGFAVLLVDGHVEGFKPKQWHLLTNHSSRLKWHPE